MTPQARTEVERVFLEIMRRRRPDLAWAIVNPRTADEKSDSPPPPEGR